MQRCSKTQSEYPKRDSQDTPSSTRERASQSGRHKQFRPSLTPSQEQPHWEMRLFLGPNSQFEGSLSSRRWQCTTPLLSRDDRHTSLWEAWRVRPRGCVCTDSALRTRNATERHGDRLQQQQGTDHQRRRAGGVGCHDELPWTSAHRPVCALTQHHVY